MARITIDVDIICRHCGSDDVEILDYSDMTWFCRCNDCKRRFEAMRE